MASSTSNGSDSNTQKRSSPAIDLAGQVKTERATDLVIEKIRARYPGGLDAFIADYHGEKKTVRQLMNDVRIEHRAMMRAFARLGIQPRDSSLRMMIARKLNPQWNENISRGKLDKPFYHSPEVIAAATVKRKKLFRTDPSRHGQSHIGMSRREIAVKAMCDRHGVRAEFNKAAAGFFMDFYLPDLGIGIEVQRSQSLPDRERCEAITNALQLRTLLYVPGVYLYDRNAEYIDSLIQTLSKDHTSIADTIGDARYLCQTQGRVDARWYGFGFRRRWNVEPRPLAEVQCPTEHQPEQ